MTVLLCKACDKYTQHNPSGRRMICRICGAVSYEAPKDAKPERRPVEHPIK